ncbi:MAG: type II toxin-antitoxin system HipA family toxin [Fibrobacteria bacterium]|nr:type II toxin-antitoxin system HipA family toxin [Fibrobacteria bacterium]
MKKRIEVCLGEGAIAIGTLAFEAKGNRKVAAFSYNESWLSNPDKFELSPDLPLVPGYQYRSNKVLGQSAFFDCFADVEPDGWGRMIIKRDYAKQRKASQEKNVSSELLNDFDYLLWISDFSRVGAIRFRDDSGVFQRPSEGKNDIPQIIKLPHLLSATKAIEENRETAKDLAFLRGNGTSLGGMRPKCSIIDTDGTLAIGKFSSVKDMRSIVHGEVLALNLARAAGINAAKARVVDSEGVPVAVISRFDRVNNKRLMYLSARSLMSAIPGEQYTYVQIAETIRKYSCQAASDLKELYQRMVFNILINNIDDHLNNHGFLYNGRGQWKMSPAFDINPFPDKERTLKTWISEDAGEDASLSEAGKVAPLFGLSSADASDIFNKQKDVISGWKSMAREIGMSAVDVEAYAPSFNL